jgi:phospholipid/cholesterol/gamma-HCH transport system substrate-binding protein
MSIFKRKRKADASCPEGRNLASYWREIKIGLFLGMGLIILALFIFVVGDFGNLFQKKGYSLYANFKSVSGLEKKTVVRLAGVKVGFVQEIGLKGNQAEVEMAINPDVKISKDSTATLASLGLLGEKYIEINPGTEKELAQAGDTIGSQPAFGFDQMGTTLSSLGDEIKKTSQSLRELLGEKATRENLNEILSNMSLFSSELNDFLQKNKPIIAGGLEKASKAVDDFDQKVDGISKNLDEFIRLLKDTVEENRVNLKENIQGLKEMLSKTEESLKLLNEVLEKLHKGDGTLGKLIQDPDLIDKTEKAVGDIQKIVTPVSSVKINLGLRAEYFAQSELVRGALSFMLWPSSDKFVLAQIVHDPWKDRFTYSAEGGLRWGAFAPRAGIIESEFGVGLDVYAFRDRMVIALEGFDFNRDPRPRFRAWTSFLATKYIHFLLGWDDFTLAQKRELYFGLRFGF